jgi:hypothetical protein
MATTNIIKGWSTEVRHMLKEKKHICGAINVGELSFESERGIGQGKIASSLQWITLYDMVLEWIDPKSRHLHVNKNLREYSEQTAINAALYAYANVDDLATCSAGPQAKYMQQLQTKWLSTFSTFSGLTIRPGNIKITIECKIDPKHELKIKLDKTKYYPSTLTVFDHQWEPTECSIEPTLVTYKYLGIHRDLRCKNNDVFEREKAKAVAMQSHLLTQVVSSPRECHYRKHV